MPKITIYSTATCGFCRMLKSYLQSKDITYNEVKVDENPEEAKKLYEMSGQLGVPFTVIDMDDGSKKAILGFDKPQFDKVLGL